MGFLDNLLNKARPGYEPGSLYTPVSGKYVPIEDVPDATFASGVLGKGLGIEPDDGKILSPAEGVVTAIATTRHAVGITTGDGAELLIHIGLDTVNMKGEGFVCHVKEGQTVKFGQKLIDFDRDKIHAAGFPATVIFTVTNSDTFGQINIDCPETVQCLQLVGSYVAG